MRKLFKQIHLWLSVPFGIVITIICLSGAALVFETEITEWLKKDLYEVRMIKPTPLPVGDLMSIVTKTLPDSVGVTGVTINCDPKRAYRVNLSKPRRASLYIDQYTGEIKGNNERLPFFLFMFRTHRWLLDTVKPAGEITWGKMIVGVSTLMFVFVLISGVVIWVPRTRKALSNRLKITTRKGLPRFWYDLHVSAGIYATVFLLGMALTGLTWSFEWYRTGFYKIFGVEMSAPSHGAPSSPNRERSGGAPEQGGKKRGGAPREKDENPANSSFITWNHVLGQLVTINPGYENITVSDGKASVSFNGFGNQRASDNYSFNPRNGKITEIVSYADSEKSSKIRGWIYTVHVGSWGGVFSRIITFLVALIGASLPLTGYYLWIRRIRR